MMPRYDYRCPTCGHEEEREYYIFEIPEVGDICPDCSFSAMKRVLSPVAVSFQGGGFYSTDNRRKEND